MTFFRTYGVALILGLLFTACSLETKTPRKPKIAIAGLAIESSTFSPATTAANAFLARQGEAIFDYYPFLDEDSVQRNAATWLPALRGHALPGGIVTREAYDSLVGVTLELLKENIPMTDYFLIYTGR